MLFHAFRVVYTIKELDSHRAGRYIACDSHSHLVSKAGSLISG